MIHKIEEVLEAYKKGKMVILIDDENRENEGDLLAPASLIKAEHINFMSKYARGLICLTLSADRCEHLQLPMMPSRGNSSHSTNFTVSIEAIKGVSTGISAEDRTKTILTAVAPKSKAEDIISPGHIFPLRAKDGGVLVRAGHTEAGCDLARLTNMPEAASVIVEIMNDDGSMARLPDLQAFSKQHNIKLGTIADLIRYRLEHEKLIFEVKRQEEVILGQIFQTVTFYDNIDQLNHIAFVKGDISEDSQEVIPVRVHLQDYLQDVFNLQSEHPASWNLQEALEYLAKQPKGVLVLLDSGQTDIVKEMDSANTPVNHYDERNYGKGSQILNALGVKRINVLGSKSFYRGINGFGLKVLDFIVREE